MTGRHDRGRRSGSLLVITLWLITILAVLAVAISRYLSVELRLTKYRLAREEAKWLARSGVHLAMQRLAHDTEAYDWLGDDWAQFPQQDPLDGGSVWVIPAAEEPEASGPSANRVEVQIIDAERKLDVNAIAPIVTPLGALIGSTDLANAIVDYADEDGDGAWESPVEQPPYYYPKNMRVVALEELLEIPDMTVERYDTVESLVFAVPETEPIQRVNINTAAPDVLATVGLPTLAGDIVGFREQGHYFTSLSPDVKIDDPTVPIPFESDNTEFLNARDRLGVASQVFLVTSTGRVGQPSVQHRVQAVIQRASEGSKILAWREG